LAEVLEHRVAADERRRLGREVVRPAIEGRQGRKLRRQVPVGDLEEMLRPAEILQPVIAEIAERGGRRNTAVEAADGRTGEQDLAAVADRHDSGGPVDGGPEEIAATRLGL